MVVAKTVFSHLKTKKNFQLTTTSGCQIMALLSVVAKLINFEAPKYSRTVTPQLMKLLIMVSK